MDERGPGQDALDPAAYQPPKGLWQRVQRSEVWRSGFRHPQLDTPRGRALQSFSNLFLHVYPVKVPGRVLRFRYSWRLGYILTVLFAITYLSGIYLMFFYTPSVASAYGDMQQLRTGIGFGQLVRNVHRWSAHLMVLVVVLHLARVFFAGAYKRPRQFNWVLGLGLLLATLGLSFSGYLLPWDQLSYWAVTVGTNLVNYVPALGRILRDLLLGGAQIGEQRVRLLGVVDRESVTAEERRVEDTVFTWPHLLVRHVVVGLATAAVVLTLGVAFAAPLRGLANPDLTPEPSKAPWYFVGLQELLSHVDPLVAGVLIPLGTILGLALLPYLDRNPATEARNRKVAILLFATLLVIATALTIIGVFFRGPGWRFIPPWRHLYVEL